MARVDQRRHDLVEVAVVSEGELAAGIAQSSFAASE